MLASAAFRAVRPVARVTPALLETGAKALSAKFSSSSSERTAGTKAIDTAQKAGLDIKPAIDPKIVYQPSHPIAVDAAVTSKPDTNLDWETMGFDFKQTAAHTVSTWAPDTKDWGPVVVTTNSKETRPLGHDLYSHGPFEGMKATPVYDGDKLIGANIFRPDFHLARLNKGLEAVGMPIVSKEVFETTIATAVSECRDSLPPKDIKDGALYIRVDVFQKDETLGNYLNPAMRYDLRAVITPVRAYYKPSKEGGKLYNLPIPRVVSWSPELAIPGTKGTIAATKQRANYGIWFKVAQALKTERGYTDAYFIEKENGKAYAAEATSSNSLLFFTDKGKPGTSVVVRPFAFGNLEGCTSTSILTLLNEKLGIPAIDERVPIDTIMGKASLE